MALFLYSEYQFSILYTEPDTGHLMLTDPNPVSFLAFDDNIPYEVIDGDTVFSIAHRAFKGFPRPAGLWKVICDYNDIHDHTLPLERGTLLYLPSYRTMHDTVFSADRYAEVSAAVVG